MARDPVCKMNVDEKKAGFKSEYEGETYHIECAVPILSKLDSYPFLDPFFIKLIFGLTEKI